MDDFVWLDIPLHKNKFLKLELEELDTVKMSFDGSIMAVKKTCVESSYKENEVEMVKAGYKSMPKDIKVETLDDLYNVLSYYISL